MEINEIIEYTTKTPMNTNPAVLRGMLESIATNYKVFDLKEHYVENGAGEKKSLNELSSEILNMLLTKGGGSTIIELIDIDGTIHQLLKGKSPIITKTWLDSVSYQLFPSITCRGDEDWEQFSVSGIIRLGSGPVIEMVFILQSHGDNKDMTAIMKANIVDIEEAN